jgi:omega-6 fatty acid desaturase (delta-12 desaturase)
LRDYPELRDVSRVTLLHSLRCVRLVLWDESRQRLISFREVSSRERDLEQTSPHVS